MARHLLRRDQLIGEPVGKRNSTQLHARGAGHHPRLLRRCLYDDAAFRVAAMRMGMGMVAAAIRAEPGEYPLPRDCAGRMAVDSLGEPQRVQSPGAVAAGYLWRDSL
jgi:hypothetical protein